jgi:hypothetical protein
MGYFKSSEVGRAMNLNEIFHEAREVCAQLDEWGEQFDCADQPQAAMMVTAFTLGIQFGDFIVWNSEENDRTQLNYRFCQGEFKKRLAELTTFPE